MIAFQCHARGTCRQGVMFAPTALNVALQLIPLSAQVVRLVWFRCDSRGYTCCDLSLCFLTSMTQHKLAAPTHRRSLATKTELLSELHNSTTQVNNIRTGKTLCMLDDLKRTLRTTANKLRANMGVAQHKAPCAWSDLRRIRLKWRSLTMSQYRSRGFDGPPPLSNADHRSGEKWSNRLWTANQP